jgi:N-hydroxyarylamine O-acetyltransferase
MPQDELDLDAYCARIGLRGSGAPSLTLLRSVVALHAASIPFENLDIVLGRPIRLDIASLQAKLVGAGRGGYCFEQNTLLRAALQRLGFSVTNLMARVVRGTTADAITPRTHMLLCVELPEGEAEGEAEGEQRGAYLADVGFGNLTPTAPLRLGSPMPQPTGHEDYRLLRIANETLLQARLGGEWANVYRFAAEPSHPIDHEVGNWFTSTRPNGLFTANVIAARPSARGRSTLFNGELTLRDPDNRTQRIDLDSEISLRDALQKHFGIVLDAADLAAVQAAMRRFAARTDAGPRLD